MSKEIVSAQHKRNKTELVKTSRQQSAIVLAQMLDRAGARTGHEVTPGESEDWIELLEQEPSPGIRWAFMEHAKVSEFFPKPSEILGLVRTWRMVEAQHQEDEQKREEASEIARRIEAGEKFYGLADVIAEFKKVVDERTDLGPDKKQELRKRVDELVRGKRKPA